MNKYIEIIIIFYLVIFSLTCQAGQISVSECNIAGGLTVEQFKQEYYLLDDPKLMYTDANRPTQLTDQQLMRINKKYYRFKEFGIRVFFDMQGKLKTIKIEPPFKGAIGEIYLGDSKELLFEIKGIPDVDDANGIIYRSEKGYVSYRTTRGKVSLVFADHCG